MYRNRFRAAVLWLLSTAFFLSSSLSTAETRAKHESALTTQNHIQNVLENKDPRSLWLLLTRSGIVMISGLVDDDPAQGSPNSRLASETSFAVTPRKRVTLKSCRALIQAMSSEIDDWFGELFEATSVRSRREIRGQLQQLKDEFYKRKMEQLLVSLGVPKDWQEENQTPPPPCSAALESSSLVGVMKLLGHRNIKMTLRYVEVTNEDLGRDYLKAMEKARHRYADLKDAGSPESDDQGDPLIEVAFD